MPNVTIKTAAAAAAVTLAMLLTTDLTKNEASAATVCKAHEIGAKASSAGGIAKFRKRRAARRAVKAWKRIVTNQYGGKHANFRGRIHYGVEGNRTTATAVQRIAVCH